MCANAHFLPRRPHTCPKSASTNIRHLVNPVTINTETAHIRGFKAGGSNLGTFGSSESKAAYDRQIATWLANGRRLTTPTEMKDSPAPVTVAELLALYWDYAETKYGRRRSAVKTLSHIKQAMIPLREHFGALPAESFGPVALEQLRESYIAKGLSRNTVNDRVRIVKDIFSLAVRRQMVPLSLKHGLAEVKGLQADESNAPEPKRVKPVPDAYVDAVLDFVLPSVQAMIEIQRLTGMRPGEVVIMRASDIDMTGPLWSYKPKFHKTMRLGHEREVMLGPKAQETIRPFLKTTRPRISLVRVTLSLSGKQTSESSVRAGFSRHNAIGESRALSEYLRPAIPWIPTAGRSSVAVTRRSQRPSKPQRKGPPPSKTG
jgi:integrase